MSLNSQRQLAKSTNELSSSYQRLSSGLRINSASDDAAGLQISSRLTSQVNGLNQASRNANDAISLSQTAEGALDEYTNNLQRMRTLAVQSSNGSNTFNDRSALNNEYQELKAEQQRIIDQTSFGGVKLLDGSFDESFQIGANPGQTIALTIDDSLLNDIGIWTSATSTASSALTSAKAEFDAADAANDMTGMVTAIQKAAIISTTAANADALAAPAAATVAARLTVAVSEMALGNVGSVSLVGASAFSWANIGLAVSATASNAVVTLTPIGTGPLGSSDISTFPGAQLSIDILDDSLQIVNTVRADLGAKQNRFASIIRSNDNTVENLSASRSRIQDTDFASESAKLARNSVLQQASSSMLAQANQQPQIALSLL